MRSGPIRTVLAVVAALLAMALLASCADAGEEETGATTPDGAPVEGPSLEDVNLQVEDGPGQPGGKITYGTSAETDGWNPTNSRWSPSGLVVAKSIFDTLAAYDEDLNWKANFAEAFEHNEDYTEWKIRLRPDLVFHDGSPIDGQAVADTLNALKDSPLTGQPFEPIESIEATGPLEVTVIPEMAWTNWPYAMTTQIGVVAQPEWVASGETRNPIGSGAFRFESWVPNDRLIVTRFDDYWREGYPLLDEVEFRPITDELTRSNALETGQLNIMMTTTGSEVAKFKQLAADTGDYQVVNDPGGETEEFLVMLNTKQPPLDDVRVRRALAHATDRDTLIETVGEGEFQPAYGPYAPGSPWYVETDYPRYDLAAAQQLVDEVEAETGAPVSVTINAPPSPTTNEAMQLIQSQWEEAGVDVSISTLDTTQLISTVIAGSYQATAWTQFDSPHPLGDSVWWHPESSRPLGEFALNMARNENPAIGTALDSARETTDPDEEKRLYNEAVTELAGDVPYIWLYHVQITIVAKSDLVNIVDYELPDGSKGLPLHGGAHPLWQVWLRT